MSSTETRAAALRLCLTALAVLATLSGWIVVLSFSISDPPSSSVYTAASKGFQNICGPVGAWVAFKSFYYFGVGTYALLGLLTLATLSYCRETPPRGMWARSIGGVLIIAATCTVGTLFIAVSDRYLMTGPGGVVGLAAARYLLPKFDVAGTTIAALGTSLVGMLLVSEELFIGMARLFLRLVRQAGPVVSGGSAALANVGSTISGAAATVAAGIGVRGDSVELADGPKLQRGGEQLELGLKPAPADKRKPAADEPDDSEDEDEYEYEYEYVDVYDDSEEDVEDDDAEETESETACDDNSGEETEEDDGIPDAPGALAMEKLVKDVAAPAPLIQAMLSRREPPQPVPYHRPPDDDGYEVPSQHLLDQSAPIDTTAIESLCRDKAQILEQTLQEFRLEVRVVAIETGPVITVFELQLAPGIKVSQIASLTNDMARALRAPAVRVVAPLPKKNTIGIEVPNFEKEKVRIRDVIQTAGPMAAKAEVPLFLGKDASGQALVEDLTRMPHLLVAGTTGSGKSVCIASIVMSVLLTRTPSEVQLILIDPKVVELTAFKNVPHLMCPIVSDMAKAEAILDWASTKMDERYALLAEAGVKDIKGYNRLGEEGLRERLELTTDEEFERVPKKLPYMVIIIDELADLMMTSAKEVEFYLCRIAQKSRAVGIHLIVSTQRPSANVVTGLIKSNLPSRIAFRVASRLDSRIVLDQNGGEVLMGQGDLLFLPPGQSKLIRAQGTFVGDSELRAVVKHCASQCSQSFHPELLRSPSANTDGVLERDELFDSAVDTIVASGRGSVSLLQRKLTIGYSRASRLIEQMYQAGIVGEYKGSQAREVLLTADEWEAAKKQRDREEAEEQAHT